MKYNKKRAKEVYDYVQSTSYQAAADHFDITKESIKRYCRQHKNKTGYGGKQFSDKLIEQLSDKYTEAELKAILKGGHDKESHRHKFNFKGDRVKFGIISDSHLGSKFSVPELLYEAFEVFNKEDVDFIVHSGDVFEGMSGRAGHIYELSHVGYEAQLDHGREVFSKYTDKDIYIISGNHDEWFKMSNGADIVKELCRDQDNLIFLGHDEGDIDLHGSTLKLWHGKDGSSYALSYRPQKLIESLTGGEKPNILVCGHVHKALYLFERHVHCVSAACIQKQTKWMRGKKLSAHTGFQLAECEINKQGVAWFNSRFYPAYI